MGMMESEIQTRVVQFVRTFYPDVLIFSIPNGANTTPKNRLRLVREGMLAGVPDIQIAKPKKGFHGLFIEFKTTEGTVKDSQMDVINKLHTEGYLCYVARTHLSAIKIIEDYLND